RTSTPFGPVGTTTRPTRSRPSRPLGSRKGTQSGPRYAPTPCRDVCDADALHQGVTLEDRADPASQRAGALPVDDPHVQDPLLLAGREVGIEQVWDIPGPEGVEIELAVDGQLHRCLRIPRRLVVIDVVVHGAIRLR